MIPKVHHTVKLQIFKIVNETIQNLLSEEIANTLWDLENWSVTCANFNQIREKIDEAYNKTC